MTTVETAFDEALAALGYENTEGLVRSSDAHAADSRGFVWHELQSRGGADAAYFNGGVPLVAFARAETSEHAQDRHRQLWNLGRVPLLIAVTPQTVEAFSCFVGPDADGESRAANLASSALSEADDVLRAFARVSVDRGLLATEFESSFSRRDRVDRRLLDSLRDLRSALGGESERRRSLDRVIGRSIFIRYFEDRGVLTPALMADLVGHEHLIEVLDSGQADTYDLFTKLAERFNGDVFGIPAAERDVVGDNDLSTMAAFFSGTDLQSQQQTFWPYDFAVIPSELISSIYEQLLEEDQVDTAAFYTPRPVVDLILDEVLPWDRPNTQLPRILDPSCGSGIFLTESFRRLVHSRRLARPSEPDFDELSEILQTSIFGVDLSEAAVSVAALGLYLTLLESIDPPTVWREAHLPALVGTNLIVSDYFSVHELSDETFDIVAGNPPWKSALTLDASRYVSDAGVEVADKQLAIAFLHRAYAQLTDGGSIGLLLPSKPLLHNQSLKAVRARKRLFTDLAVDSVIDLSLLRKGLFSGATAPAAILVARQSLLERSSIVHTAPRVSPLQAMADGFVVSQEDIHFAPTHLASSVPWIWKTLAWGSMDDVDLVSRIRTEHPNLRSLCLNRQWKSGRGYQINGGDKNDSTHLLGRMTVEAEAVLPFSIDHEHLSTVTTPVMHRPRKPLLYQGSQALFRIGGHDGLPAAVAVEEALVYTDSVFGIAAPPEDFRLLQLVAAFTNSSLGRYLQFMTSPSWGIERNYLGANEFLALPVAIETDGGNRTTLDRLKTVATDRDRNWEKTLDNLVFDAYGLDQFERQLVLDGLDMKIDQFENGAKSKAFRPPDEALLRRYEESLTASMRDVLNPHPSHVWISDAESFYRAASIALPSPSGDGPARPSSDIVQRLHSRVEGESRKEISPAIILQPSLIVLDGQFVHLIKPDEARSWTQSSAHHDAAAALGAAASGIR